MYTTDGDGLNIILTRIREEILPLLDAAILDDSITYANPHLATCWKTKNCTAARCPLFNKEADLRCWQAAGTYCGGKVQGVFAQKFASCKLCEVYRTACPTIVEELGEGLNNYLYIRRQHAKQLHDTTYFNRELASAIANLDAKNHEIQELVITDKLTGLYNRSYLFTVLDDEIARCQKYHSNLSLLMMDLDDFKSTNDEHGHLAGDRVLSSLGAFLKSMTRRTDRCFRFGGEEFVAVLPETEIAVANIIANRIQEECEKHVVAIDGANGSKSMEISRTLSIGVTHYREGSTSHELLKEADRAMYEAKLQGKNRVIRHDFIASEPRSDALPSCDLVARM